MREPPPDLSSFLMQQRIVYLGLPLQSSVTELLIAEFMYLNSHEPDKPVSFYINSTGISKDGARLQYNPEAFAIYDMMGYIQPKVHTLCVGTAWGEAAMLLAAGEKGNRVCLPTSSIMIRQPLGMTRGQATNLDLGRHEIRITTSHVIETLATHTGKAQEQIAADIARPRYMDAQGAVDYGIVDTILSEKQEQIEARGLA